MIVLAEIVYVSILFCQYFASYYFVIVNSTVLFVLYLERLTA